MKMILMKMINLIYIFFYKKFYKRKNFIKKVYIINIQIF